MSTATSDGGPQKLENDVRRDSESIAGKVCSPISRKWNATCQRKWRNRSKLSSTAATTDGGAQMLGNNVWNDYESIATNVCSQIGRQLRSQMKCYVWKPCRDQHWQIELAASIFDLKIFWAIFLCFTDQPSIPRSQRSVSSSWFSLFPRLMSCSMSNEKKLCKLKIFELQLCPTYVKCDKMYQSKFCVQEFWNCVSGLDIRPELS